MSTSHNFFQSAGGIELCPEICLKVAEELIAVDPKSIKNVLLTSKPLYALLKTYERSICRSVPNKDHRFSWVNVEQQQILSSRMPLGNYSVIAYTYAWLSEMVSRAMVVDFLVNHALTDMIDHHAQSWPTLNIPKEELLQRVVRFKRLSFRLLYRLADCTTSAAKTLQIRANQAEFLESLTRAELASLGVIVEVMGQNYFTMTKNALDKAASRDFSNPRMPPEEWFFAPLMHRLEEASGDNWIRECMCVFEDLIQRFGPYFPYAFIEGGKDRLLRPDLWAQNMLQQGLDNMNAFELGYTMSFASLQSVVWKVFCRKEGCALHDSWNMAKEIIETEMQGYDIGADE